MLDKRLKILLAIVIVLLLGRGLYVLVMKEGNIVEESNEQPEEVVVAEPMDIEITDLKGPKQKYTNKTLGFSFEFPDELEHNHEYKNNNLFDYFINDKECLKNTEADYCDVHPSSFYWFDFSANADTNLGGTCNDYLIKNKIEQSLNDENKEFDIILRKDRNFNLKGLNVREVMINADYEGNGTGIYNYFCLNQNTLIMFSTGNGINMDETEKFNPLYQQYQEVLNSLELLSE